MKAKLGSLIREMLSAKSQDLVAEFFLHKVLPAFNAFLIAGKFVGFQVCNFKVSDWLINFSRTNIIPNEGLCHLKLFLGKQTLGKTVENYWFHKVKNFCFYTLKKMISIINLQYF